MNRIKELRAEKNIFQSKFASLLKVRQNTISNWETGRSEPDQDALREMSKIFGVSIDYILGNTDIKKAPSYEDAGLSTEEAALLDSFRKLTNDQKAFVLQAVEAEAIRRAGEHK